MGRDDWGNCTVGGSRLGDVWSSSPPHELDAGLMWQSAQYELTLQAQLFEFDTGQGNIAPAFDRRRGAARDRYGNWYWIDEDGKRIRVNSEGTGNTTDFWPDARAACRREEIESAAGEFQPRTTPPPLPGALSGLSVTTDHYLVVGTLEPKGLLVFDLHAGGAPQQLLWPADVAFEPFDMDARPRGGVLILDRANRCYWAIDRRFNVINLPAPSLPLAPHAAANDETEFRPREAQQTPALVPCAPPSPINAGMAARLNANDPVAIAALPDGSLLILDYQPGQNFSAIRHYLGGDELGQAVLTDAMLPLIEQPERANFSLVGYDMAFVPAHQTTDASLPDRLYVVGPKGEQAFAFNITWAQASQPDAGQLTLDPVAAYLPMRLFGGKGLSATSTDVFYDFADRWIPLVEQRRPRYVAEATLETPLDPLHVFDSLEPDCVWHRLLIDACIPPETKVEVWSRAANDLAELATARWLKEPSLYLRGDGSELPFAPGQLRTGDERAQTRAKGSGTWELLFQRARGRYLQLQLHVVGSVRNTPRLSALRAYFPRFSYIEHYLPAVYREDVQSASFLDRFLANVEGLYTTLEDKIAAVEMLFDVRSAPADVLDWLAGWFGVALDPAWDETKRRLFIKHALFFFQYRGTMHGLELALRLALDDCIDESEFAEPSATNAASGGESPRSFRLVEAFRTRSAPAVLYGDTSAPAVTPLIETVAQVTKLPPAVMQPQAQTHSSLFNSGSFTVRNPGGAGSAQWKTAAQAQFGFVPSAKSTDAQAWGEFLARRYQHVGALNAQYGTKWGSFDDVPLPDTAPAASALLADWYQFESVVLAMRSTAHQFTVLLPVRSTDTSGTDAQQNMKDLTTRIVALEKPAHTVFDVRFYWAMFRLGEVRLGDDTLLDYGSRAPSLLPPMVLGQEHLAESYLAPGHPQDVRDRLVVGRG
jgi:phage tail-like protein